MKRIIRNWNMGFRIITITVFQVLMVFYFAIPFGSGAGYMVGSAVASATGEWQWGIRVTPIAGLISILALIFILQEPVRGEAEKLAGASYATEDEVTTYWQDIKYLWSVKTYLWANIGYTSVVFVTGTLGWWVPTAIQYSVAASKVNQTSDLTDDDNNQVSLIFGAITCVGGIIGVSGGVLASQVNHLLLNPQIEIICITALARRKIL